MSFQQVIQSVWSLRLGLALAYLPIPAFGATLIYSSSVARHAQLIPEDLWPILGGVVCFLWFAGMCLVPSVALLTFHLQRSRSARWALGCAIVEALAILSFI